MFQKLERLSNLERGDFTNLADDYAKYRPSYNEGVVELIVSFVQKSPNHIRAADVGAGTGIFTNCLSKTGLQDLVAVEPNEDMRKAGSNFLGGKRDTAMTPMVVCHASRLSRAQFNTIQVSNDPQE